MIKKITAANILKMIKASTTSALTKFWLPKFLNVPPDML